MLPITSAPPDLTNSNAAGLLDARLTMTLLNLAVKNVSGPEYHDRGAGSDECAAFVCSY